MVPRKKAEEAMRKILEGRETKTIPTEDLMELAKIVLNNNEWCSALVFTSITIKP